MALSTDEQEKAVEAFKNELSRIGTAKRLIPANRKPDQIDLIGKRTLKDEHDSADLKNKWLLIGLREKYGTNVIRFMWVYFLVTLAILIANGFGLWSFKLPDAVLVALIGGTAVSVLGVVGTIASGLFKPPA